MSASIAAYGRLGRDPELRTSKAGKPWATASIAVTTDDDANVARRRRVDPVAEVLDKHLGRVLARRRLQLRRWTDDAGKEHERLQVIADEIVSARHSP